jgi:beta-lactamase class A
MHLERDKPVSLNARLGRRPGKPRLFGLLGLGAASLVIGGFAWVDETRGPARIVASGIQSARTAVPRLRADCSASPDGLQQDLTRIAQGFDGKVGIAVAKAGCDWIVGERTRDYFPQQSVSKLWVSLAVFDAVDRRKLGLDQPLELRPQHLTVFNQPLRWQILEQGSVTLPVEALVINSLSLSDNTANDRLLWTVGGPRHVRELLDRNALEGIRFGPGESLLQSQIAGLKWRPELAEGNNFEAARARLPVDQRAAALSRYVADPIDGAQPAGMVQALARLAAGELLSPQSTQVMLTIMGKSRSGPRRLKAGVPAGWKVFHKTGTGQELRGTVAGYNDVAIFKTPDGSFYSVAVMIGETRRPVQERMQMMQAVSRAVGRFHESGARQTPIEG